MNKNTNSKLSVLVICFAFVLFCAHPFTHLCCSETIPVFKSRTYELRQISDYSTLVIMRN